MKMLKYRTSRRMHSITTFAKEPNIKAIAIFT